jgi:RNA polymerase sigma factor (sigma-70 family)
LIDYSKYEDSELLVLLKEDVPVCEQAFQVIWYRYSIALRQYCYFKSENYEDSEDIFQQTWIKFYYFARKEHSIRNIKSYLLKMAFNEWLLFEHNKEALSELPIDLEKIFNNTNHLNMLENIDISSHVYKALYLLDEVSKECFLLHWVEELNFQEISAIIDTPYETVKKRCYRAIDKIQDILTPLLNELKQGETK